MQYNGKRCEIRGLVCLALAVFLYSGSALAHGLGWEADGSYSVTVRFYYDDGQPMAFGMVKVFSPTIDRYPYQNSRTDLNGYLPFRPNEPGLWRFIGEDGQGHITEGTVEITAADLAGRIGESPRLAVQGGVQKPGIMQIALGLSILLNIALASLWYSARQRGKKAVEGRELH